MPVTIVIESRKVSVRHRLSGSRSGSAFTAMFSSTIAGCSAGSFYRNSSRRSAVASRGSNESHRASTWALAGSVPAIVSAAGWTRLKALMPEIAARHAGVTPGAIRIVRVNARQLADWGWRGRFETSRSSRRNNAIRQRAA